MGDSTDIYKKLVSVTTNGLEIAAVPQVHEAGPPVALVILGAVHVDNHRHGKTLIKGATAYAALAQH